jgi:tyrosine-protein kinase Etk/Wzc
VTTLEQKRTELLGRYTREHPIVQGVSAQIRGVEREIAAAGRRIQTLPGLEQDAARMAREIKVNTDLYTALSNTAQQLRLVSAGRVSNVRLVDAPVAPEKPLKPNRHADRAAGASVTGVFAGPCWPRSSRDRCSAASTIRSRIERCCSARAWCMRRSRTAAARTS